MKMPFTTKALVILEIDTVMKSLKREHYHQSVKLQKAGGIMRIKD